MGIPQNHPRHETILVLTPIVTTGDPVSLHIPILCRIFGQVLWYLSTIGNLEINISKTNLHKLQLVKPNHLGSITIIS